MNGLSRMLAAAIEDAGTHQADTAVDSCTFCLRQRRQVILLVVCGDAAICVDCITAAADAARQALQVRNRVESESKPAMYRGVPRGNGHAPLAGPDPYTGEMCDQCFNFRMVRTGTCSTCQDCGSASGGCS